MDEQKPAKARENSLAKTRRMTGLAIFSALIVVLQLVSNFVKFGPVTITLALAPIIIGAALYGSGAGAILGFVLGLVVFISGLFGLDGGFVQLLMAQNAFAAILICLVKTTVAGWLAGLVYKAIQKKHRLAAVITSGIVCPVVNTGLFILGMVAFFFSTLQSFANGTAMLYYIIVTLTGVNFLIELGVNMVLASGITRIIQAGSRRWI